MKHQLIPADWEVQPLGSDETPPGATTCGHCGLTWDDDKCTSMTPTPAARCPFEPFHVYPDDIEALLGALTAPGVYQRVERMMPASAGVAHIHGAPDGTLSVHGAKGDAPGFWAQVTWEACEAGMNTDLHRHFAAASLVISLALAMQDAVKAAYPDSTGA